MTIVELITLTLQASIIGIVFSLGLRSDFVDLIWLFRRPGKLAQVLLIINVIMPVFAALTIVSMSLHRGVAIALMALALAPVPPILPRKQAGAGGDRDFAIAMLFAIGLLSIVWIPIALKAVQWYFEIPLGVSPFAVSKIIFVMIVLPLVAGIAVRAVAKPVAVRIHPIISMIADIVLVIVSLLVLYSTWRAIVAQIGDGTIFAYLAFILFGLAAGHLLGGPDSGERTDIALAAASKHPGMALAIAHLNFPEEKAVLGAILLFLLLNLIAVLPYIRWRTLRRRRVASQASSA